MIKKKSNCVRNFLILFHRVNSSYARVVPSYHVYLLSRLVVPVSEKLSSTFRKPGWKKIVSFGSRTWVPISLVWPNEGLGCPVYYAYQALCVQFCFGFNLLLSTAYFCVPLYRIFIDNSFRFCIKLFTYFGLNYCTWTCFTLAYLGTMALIWPSFCFIKFTNLCEWNYLQRV